MGKGAKTREYIIERAIEVFNCRGYSGASMTDIMAATGLNKGGIYNHFASKEELALASFDFAVDTLTNQLCEVVDRESSAVGKLLGVLRVFVQNIENAPFAGGCPLLNMAIESDDAHPELRERVRKALGGLQRRIRRIVLDGIHTGELVATADADGLASVFVSTLEGATMLSHLYRDPVHMDRAVAHLTEVIQARVRG